MRILVTGGNGLLGSNLINFLLKNKKIRFLFLIKEKIKFKKFKIY